MTPVETVHAMLAAFDERDVDEYVSHLADDVVVRPPGFIFGETEHHGPEEVRAAFAELEATMGPDRRFDLRKRRYFVDREDEGKVLVVVEILITPGPRGPVRYASCAAGDDDRRQGFQDRLLADRGGRARPARGPGRGRALASIDLGR